MALSGRGASENNSAITQLSQALASGVLRGDEFNSMMENGPRLMQALADALGTTTGALRAMAEEGKLTADILVSALKDQAGQIATEFSSLPLTIGNASTNLSNAIKGMIGDFDDANNASGVVAKSIQLVAENLDSLAQVADAAGLAAVAADGDGLAVEVHGFAGLQFFGGVNFGLELLAVHWSAPWVLTRGLSRVVALL
jgi:tape measure domain-containing protein